MQFVKYSSLTNHYENNMINAVILNGVAKDDVLWCAREKLHGCNFSFLYDGIKIQYAKRTDVVHEGEQFYACENVVAAHYPRIKKLWDLLNLNVGNELQIYGELAGNGVQKDVDYGEKDFYAFDLRVNGRYQPDDVMSLMCRSAGIKLCPLLGYGTFNKLKDLPITFESVLNTANATPLIPEAELCFPITEAGDDATNIAEGYVLKPVYPVYLERYDRVAIKCKTTKFTEKKNKQANAFKAPVLLSPADQEQYDTFACYITENRVKNVLSKLDTSSLAAKDFGRVMGLTLKDAFEEIAREHEADFITFFENPSLAKKSFTQDTTNLIRENWGSILSGTF